MGVFDYFLTKGFANMKLKNRLILLICLICLIPLLFFSLCPLERSIGKEKSIEIGLLVPRTGRAGLFGTRWQAGIEKAIKEINSRGGWNRLPLKLVVTDTKSTSKVAFYAAQKLIKKKSVKVILGPILSSATKLVIRLANDTKTIFITPAMDSTIFQRGSRYIFKVGPTYEHLARIMANYCGSLGKYRTAGFITAEHDLSKAITRVQKPIFKEYKIQIVAEEKVAPSQRDFKDFLTKKAYSKADIISLNLIPNMIPLALLQIHEAGLKTQTIDAFVLPWYEGLVAAAGTAIGGHLSADAPDYSKMGYDSVYVVFEAFKAAQSYQEVEKIRKAMITRSLGPRFYGWGGPRQVSLTLIRYNTTGLKDPVSTIQYDVPPDPPWGEEGGRETKTQEDN